ncbi:hypothetical protein J1614_006232 [Plenodomus biglobosus]|nr:hypothetical protein J1614_006232 [Plenodomus biglobosus]
MNGPEMIVRVVLPEGHAKIWTLPQSLLMSRSGYFRRIKDFREGTEMKVELADTEPQIFELFIQFLYCGKYIDKDNLNDHTKVRDSTKA